MASSRFGRFLSFLSVVIILMWGSQVQVAESADCSGDLTALATQCLTFVQIPGPKVFPSAGCCQAIKQADVPCVCSHVTKDLEMVVSMEKVVYVASCCQRPLSSGTKCGSYTVPKA